MRSLRRALLCLLLRYYIRADDLDEEDLFDLDGEGDYEDPESYIEYDQALYYDGPDDYYDGIEQFNLEDMADYPGEVSPELLDVLVQLLRVDVTPQGLVAFLRAAKDSKIRAALKKQ